LTTLTRFDPGKAEEFGAEIAEVFPVPPEFLAEAVSTLTRSQAPSPVRVRRSENGKPRPDPDPDGCARARHSMPRAILLSAIPECEDRLFPGDVRQFATGDSPPPAKLRPYHRHWSKEAWGDRAI
jgi:hypothetical protein